LLSQPVSKMGSEMTL